MTQLKKTFLKYRELWGDLRSIPQFWYDKAAPPHGRAPLAWEGGMGKAAPLREQQEAESGVARGPRLSPTHLQKTWALLSLPESMRCIWMFSAASMEMPLGHIGFDREHHRKTLGVQSKANCKANCATRGTLHFRL